MEQRQQGNIGKEKKERKEKKRKEKDKTNTRTTNQAERPLCHVMPSPKEKAFRLYSRKETN